LGQRSIAARGHCQSNQSCDGFCRSLHDQTRRSRICFIQKNDPEFDFLFKQLWTDVMEVNDKWFKFNEVAIKPVAVINK
jgi:hypothetical protein